MPRESGIKTIWQKNPQVNSDKLDSRTHLGGSNGRSVITCVIAEIDALDAVGLGFRADLTVQASVKHVFVTHRHLDHGETNVFS